MRRRALALVLLLAGAACKDESTPASEGRPDATPVMPFLTAPGAGVRIPLLDHWRTVEPSDAAVVASARRRPEGRQFTVAPRVEITVTPTSLADPDPVFRETLDELRSIGSRPNIQMRRTALSTRPVKGMVVGDIEMVYTLVGTPRGDTTIVHRSAVVLRERGKGERVVVTVTGTYLKDDEPLVGAEIQVMLDGIEPADA